MRVRVNSPVVSVPVLSKTTAVSVRATSRFCTFFTRMPSLAAQDSEATITVGTARIRAHGQATMSMEIGRVMSLVKYSTMAESISTTGVYQPA